MDSLFAVPRPIRRWLDRPEQLGRISADLLGPRIMTKQLTRAEGRHDPSLDDVATRLLRSILMGEQMAFTEAIEAPLRLDIEVREVIPTGDLADALDAANAWAGWRRASFTDQKE